MNAPAPSLKGAKAAQETKSPVRTPDTLRSDDRFEMILGLCQGPIKGIADNDLSNLQFGDTPFLTPSGEANFPGASIRVHTGLTDPGPVYPFLGSSGNPDSVNVALSQHVGVVRSTTNLSEITHIDLRFNVSQLFTSNDDGVFTHSMKLFIEYRRSGTPSWTSIGTDEGEIEISGKVSRGFIREVRISVPRSADTYEVRVTKTTPDSDGVSVSEVTWESIQTGDTKPRSYPNTAILQAYAPATDQFSSLPAVSAVYDLQLIRVPSNYDPINRSYTGIWDGTFKVAWSNNPAWVLYEVVMNEDYGLRKHFAASINKWDCYIASQWCDELVPDGRGGSQPRFTFNGVFTKAVPGIELARNIAGVFHGNIFDGLNGELRVKIDRNEGHKAVFGQENVIDGQFSYSFTDITDRPNDLTGVFINPDLDWREDRRRIANNDAIVKHGRVPLNFIALGCTDDHELVRRATAKLVTAQTETMIVSFQTNRQGLYVDPWDVILIADPIMDFGLSGRVKAISQDRTTVELRDPIYLEAGVTYDVHFQVGGGTVDRQITSEGGQLVTEFSVDEALPDLPDRAQFVAGEVKPFRIMKLEEVDGSPDRISVTAVEVNRNKWDISDNADPDAIETDLTKGATTLVDPPGAPEFERLVEGFMTRPRLDVEVTWPNSPSNFVTHYEIWYSYNGGSWVSLPSTRQNRVVLMDAVPGDYDFQIVAVNLAGHKSIPRTGSFQLLDPFTEIPNIIGLQLEGQGNSVEFQGRDAKFDWRPSTPYVLNEALGQKPYPFFKDYEVRVIDSNTGLVRRTTWVTDPSYTYTYEKNAEDGLARRFKLQVAMRDTFNRIGTFSEIEVENPPPAELQAINPRVADVSVFLEYDLGDVDLDHAGIVIRGSMTAGFDPDTEGEVFFEGPGIPFFRRDQNTEYFLRAAAYDAFGKTELNWSSEMEIKTGVTVDDAALTAITDDIQSIEDAVAGITERQGEFEGEIILKTQASTENGFVVTGMKLFAGADGASRVTFLADTFAVAATSEGEVTLPFVIENGTVFIDRAAIQTLRASDIQVDELSAFVADLGTITAGKLQSQDGNMVIDLDNKFIQITV